jgi:hypothetical protein
MIQSFFRGLNLFKSGASEKSTAGMAGNGISHYSLLIAHWGCLDFINYGVSGFTQKMSNKP